MARPRLAVGLLSAHDPFDPNAFSGTCLRIREALERRGDIRLRVLGRHRPGRRPHRIARRLRGLGLGPRPHVDAAEMAGLDLVVAPVASDMVARLPPAPRPQVYLVTDATPAFLREFYGHALPAQAERVEGAALERADRVIYSSRYMADRALEEFPGTPPAKVHVAAFGLNVDDPPEAPPRKLAWPPLRLLFVGKSWWRKGGDVALAALDLLVARGVEARLTVIGCTPEGAHGHPHVEAVPYLDKRDAGQARAYRVFLSRSHLLVLPTRGDCTPMVVAEANAFGCPVLATRMAGIPSLVREGVSGRMLEPGAPPGAWADAIEEMTADACAFARMSQASHAHRRAHLTWDAWAATVVGLAHRDAADGAKAEQGMRR